jgi:ketosteroid isomerase-like protein
MGQFRWSGFEGRLLEGQGKGGKTGETGEEFDLFNNNNNSSILTGLADPIRFHIERPRNRKTDSPGGVMRAKALVVLGGLVLGVIGCKVESSKSTSASSTARGPSEAALMETSRNWAKAAASGNVDSVLAYWSDDAVVLQPDQPALVGKSAIRQMVVGSMKEPSFSITWEPERAVISEGGDMGYLIEHNRMTYSDSTGKARTFNGKVVTIWKKDANGNWKCVVDMWSANPTEKTLPNG